MKILTLTILSLFALTLLLGVSNSYALTQTPERITSTIFPINEEISLQKVETTMYIPEDNTFPWGAVKGSVSDPVERYPVIIQIFKGEDPVHFAQVNLKGDNSYEYKFRIRNVDSQTGEVIKIFEGEYTVKIFKVIHNKQSTF